MSASQNDCLVAALSCHLGQLRGLCHQSTDWHSATFNGARHTLAFTLAGDAATAGRLREIADIDLPLRGGFVADVAVTTASAARDGLAVSLEILTIDE